MVENRPWLTFMAHAILITGLILIAFPVWMTFVASTHDTDTMLRSPVPLLPGPHMFDNYYKVLFEGFGQPSQSLFPADGAVIPALHGTDNRRGADKKKRHTP